MRTAPRADTAQLWSECKQRRRSRAEIFLIQRSHLIRIRRELYHFVAVQTQESRSIEM